MDTSEFSNEDKYENVHMDRDLEAQLIPQAIDILARLFNVPPETIIQDDGEDYNHNTDLYIAPMGLRVSVRYRRHEFKKKYRDEFTIRYRRGSGIKTEFDKIREGWGHLFLYGFLDPTDSFYEDWWLGNLEILREKIERTLYVRGRTVFDAKAIQTPMTRDGGFDGDCFIPFNRLKIGYDFMIMDSEVWTGKSLKDEPVVGGNLYKLLIH